MANIKVSALSAQSAAATTFMYGITNSSTDGKVAIGAVDGLPIFNATGDILPTATPGGIGVLATPFVNIFLNRASQIRFGVSQNIIAYADTVGPKFTDGNTGWNTFLNNQSQTADCTFTFPNASGTFALLASPAFTGTPAAPTAAVGTNTTQLATTAFVTATQSDAQTFTPLTGGAVTPTATGEVINAFINPAGTIATLTLTLPTGTLRGQTITATFTQIVTTLTVTATNIGTNGFASPVTTTATSTFIWVWSVALAKWNRIQ